MRTKLLEDLYADQLARILDAEMQQQSVLPRIEVAATSIELKRALQRHIAKTRDQVRRIEKITPRLGTAGTIESKAMHGILDEATDCIGAGMEADLLDAALIASLLGAESHELAAYTSAVSLARLLGRSEEADMLMRSLQEEKAMDDTLFALAEILTGEIEEEEHHLN